VHLTRSERGRIGVMVAAGSDEEAARVLEHVRRLVPKEAPSESRILVRFWSYAHGPTSREEAVELCSWKDVADNYGAPTRAQLDARWRGVHAATVTERDTLSSHRR
jgi:hypothetical protein